MVYQYLQGWEAAQSVCVWWSGSAGALHLQRRRAAVCACGLGAAARSCRQPHTSPDTSHSLSPAPTTTLVRGMY